MMLNKKLCIVGVVVALFMSTGCSAIDFNTNFYDDDEAAQNTEDSARDASVVDASSVPSAPPFASPYGLPGDKVFTQFPTTRPATGNKLILVDPSIPAWGAYDAEGNLVKTGRASAGRDFCPDIKKACRTVTGTFTVYQKGTANCKSSIFPLKTHGGAPMPYCMHFYKGYAVHGSYDVEDYNASHGCVRILPSSAQWLSQNFVEIGTTVTILPYKNPPKN